MPRATPRIGFDVIARASGCVDARRARRARAWRPRASAGGGDDDAARADDGDDVADVVRTARAGVGGIEWATTSTREDARDGATTAARVCIVGCGPGDPGLLTLRAFQLMRRADVVLYDRLVSNEILNLVRTEARMVYVGKRAGFHTRTQEEIHALLSAFAERGALILRLKGGDPLVFGRGGEEFEFLREKNPDVRVEVVPGITAASGVGSELGIPLTHRGVATSVRLLTGHLREGARERGEDPVDFAVTSADADTTLVVYMGLGTLPRLSEKLIESGFPRDAPAVAVERGTTVDERRVFSSIEHLPEAARECELVSPTLIIIGKTCVLSPHWPYAAGVRVGVDGVPRWIASSGSVRAPEDLNDWRAWLDVDLTCTRHESPAKVIHADGIL